MSADDGSPSSSSDRPDRPVIDLTATPPDAPGDRVEGAVLDLSDGAARLSARGAALEAVIDLRSPGAPYTYPSSPTPEPDDTAATTTDAGERSYRDRLGVAKGSADVRTAPPGM